MALEKPIPKQLPQPIKTGANSAVNQSEFLAISCNFLEARETLSAQGAIGFSASKWLQKLAGFFLSQSIIVASKTRSTPASLSFKGRRFYNKLPFL